MQEPSFRAEHAQFGLHNFHEDHELDRLAAILATPPGQRTPVVLVCGDADSGRRYFIDACVWRARQRGLRLHHTRMDFAGDEPMHPERFQHFVRQLLDRRAQEERDNAEKVVKFFSARLQPKFADSLFAVGGLSLLVEAGILVSDLVHLYGDHLSLPAAEGSGAETLRAFLRPLTAERRLVLHVPESAAVAAPVRRWLLSAAEFDANLTLVFSASAHVRNPDVADDAPVARFLISQLTESQIRVVLRERFNDGLDALARPLFDYCHGSRGLAARATAALVQEGGLAWRERRWHYEGDEHPGVVEALGPRIYDDLLDALAPLPDGARALVRQWLFTAAAGGEWIPADEIIAFLGAGADRDDFIDWLDESLDPWVEDREYDDAAWPEHLVYRFRDPLLPAVLRAHDAQAAARASAWLRWLEERFPDPPRGLGRLMLRVADRAAEEDRRRVEERLRWLVAEVDGEALCEEFRSRLREGRLAPGVLVGFAREWRYVAEHRCVAAVDALEEEGRVGELDRVDLWNYFNLRWTITSDAQAEVALAEQMLDLSQSPEERATAVGKMAWAQHHSGNKEAALEYLRQALEHLQGAPSSRLAADVHLEIGTLLLILDNASGAVEHLRLGEAMLEAIGSGSSRLRWTPRVRPRNGNR